MKIKASRADVIWSYVGTFFSLSSSFLLLPFILHFLSGNQIGMWYIFLAINGLVSLFDFGFDPTFARNIAYAWSGAKSLTKIGASQFAEDGTPNIHLLRIIIATSKRLYGMLSLAAFATVGTIGTFYVLHVGHAISFDSLMPAWIIFCIALFMNLYLGYYSALLRGLGAVANINQATFISKAIQFVLSALGLVFGFGLIAVALGFFANGIAFRILCKYSFDTFKLQQTPEWKLSVSRDDVMSTLRLVSFNAVRDGIVAISNYLVTQASSILASLFLTLTQTGVYSISLQLATAVSNISASMIYAYHPTFQSAFLNHDVRTQKKVVSRGLSMLYILTILGTLAVCVAVFPLLRIFKPNSSFSVPFFIGMSIYMFLWQQQSAGASYISDTNNVPYVRAYLVSGLLSVILTVALLMTGRFGVWSLILGPGSVQLSYNNWKWLSEVFRRLRTSLGRSLLDGSQEWMILIKRRFKRGESEK